MNTQLQTQPKITSSPIPVRGGLLQRACACGQHSGAGGECEECKKKREATLQRAAINTSPLPQVPDSVHEVLNSPGQPLDGATRSFMEPRFGHDFGGVRVHTDARASASARAVNALAYTVGNSIVFAQDRYRPENLNGRQLLAHELTHVVQQAGLHSGAESAALRIDPPDSPLEGEARRIGSGIFSGAEKASPAAAHLSAPAALISRADPDAVGYTMRLGQTPHTGIQFWPTNVTDTRVGPVSVPGGLLNGGASRLNVIIGQNLSLRRLAQKILPLWITATPFTPPGALAPLPLTIITEDELARALLVYNQTYLPVPAMTNWRAGLRFPLPVEIDELTGMATLHPLLIQQLASGFDAAWVPLLDLNAAATVAPPAATLTAEVTAFLAREGWATARGIHLGARSLTNATAELPFVRETFLQLGAASFDVALAFMDNMVNREISLLAAQRDGAAILAIIRAALAAGPAAPSASQQDSLNRANLMLGLVAAVAAQNPPDAARIQAEKTITVDTVKLDGSNHNPATDVAMANAILSQCNVRVNHGVNATATNAQTTAWMGGNTDLAASTSCGVINAEERSLFTGAAAAFGLNARFRAFFPGTFSGITASGYSFPPFCATGPAAAFRNVLVVNNGGDTASLAHELGHILLNSGAHPAGGLMTPRPARPAMRLPRLSDPQCTTLYNNA